MNTNSLSPKESRHLWICGLPKVDEGELSRIFSEFGEVESVKLLSQSDPKGFLSAYIDFYKDDDAVAAFKADIKIKGSEVNKSFCDQSSNCEEHPHLTIAAADEEQRSTTSSTGSSSSSTSSDARSSSVSSTTDSEGETEVVKQKNNPENESLILKCMNLSHHRSESSVHEALYQKCCSYSSKPKVRLYGEDEQRYALVKFQSLHDRDDALKSLHGTSLFGVKLKVTLFYNSDFPSGGRELNLHVSTPSPEDQYSSSLTLLGFSRGNPFISPGNEFDPSATRSLFVGNIHKNVSIYDLRDVFQRYGHILDVEIKKMSGNATYGFVLFFNLLSAINAKKAMDGAQLGRNRIRVGFGKGTPSKVLWVDGIDASLSETQVKSHFSKYGTVVRIGIDRSTYTAMVQFDKVDEAKDALSSVKGSFICNTHSKIMADFANRDAKAAFFTHLESIDSGQSQSFYSQPPPSTAKSLMRHRPIAILPGLPRPPLDYYSYQYVEPDYYGYRSYDVRTTEVAPRHYSQYGVGSGDYEDDLREFSKKRERERERRIDKEERKRSQYTSREYSSSDTENPRHKKQPEEKRNRKTKKIRKLSASSKSDDDCSTCVRTKIDSSTLKDKNCASAPSSGSGSTEKIKLGKESDDKGRSKEDECDHKSAVTVNKSVHKSELEGNSKIDSDSVDSSNKNVRKEPKVIITYDEDENDEVANFLIQPSPPACIASQLATSDFQEQMEALPTCVAKTLIEQSDVQTPTGTSDTSERDEKQLEDNESEVLLHSTDGRPKISIAWKEKPLKFDRLSFLQPPVSSVPTYISMKEEKLESDVSSNEDCDYDKSESHTCKYSNLSNRTQDENSPECKLVLKGKSTVATHSRSSFKDSLRSTKHSKNTRNDTTSKIKKKERISTSNNKEHKHVSSASSRAVDSHDHRRSHFSQSISKNSSSHSFGSPALYRQKSPVPHSPISRPQSPNHQRSHSPVFQRQRSPTMHSSHSSPRRPHSPTSRSSRSPTTQYSPSSYRSRSPLSHRHPSPVSHRFRSPVSGRSQRSPISGRSQRSPVSGRCHRSPFSSRSQRSPVSGRSQRSPVSDRYHRSPVSGRSQRSPVSGRSQRSPVSGRSQRSPVSDRYHRSPVSGRSQRSPTSFRSQRSRSQRSPASGRSQRNLVSGRSHRSPVSGRSQRSGRSHRSPVSGQSQRSPISDQSRRSPFSGRPHSPRSWHLQSPKSHPVSRYSRSPSPCLLKRQSQTAILKTENSISHETRKSRHIRSGQSNTSSELPNTSICKYSPPHHAHHSRSPHRVEQLYDYSPRRSSRFRASPPISSSGSRSPTSYLRTMSNNQTKSKGRDSKSASPLNQHSPPSSPISSPNTSKVNPSLCPPHLPCPSDSQNTTLYPDDDDVSEVNIITDDVHIEVDEDLSQAFFLEQLLDKYPVVWQGSLSLKNDAALLQFHFLSGNDNLPSIGLSHDMDCKIIGTIPTLRISQRMKLEPLHLTGIEKCMEKQTDYCLLLGLPCGLNSYDIVKQTSSLQKSIVSYLWLKEAAGIINLSTEQDSQITLHIFPPCQFSQSHLSKVAPDMLEVALDDAHLFIVLAVSVNDNS